MRVKSGRLKVLPLYRPYLFLLAFCVASLLSCASTPNQLNGIELEQSICGLKEAIVFWLWSNAAGESDISRITGNKNLEDLTFTTEDQRTLRGLQLKAYLHRGSAETVKGYLLVAQGNAMLAEHIINSFQDFASAGYDVYIFDFRGYGRSEGKRRLKAILSDYAEIIDHLDSLPYATRLFYGMSFGGMVLLDALHGRSGAARIVIDSTPSRLSGYGCPERHDPVMNLPEDCTNLLMIIGNKDSVVKTAMSMELLGLASMRGADVLLGPDLAHPFMDGDMRLHRRRMNAVRSFLLAE